MFGDIVPPSTFSTVTSIVGLLIEFTQSTPPIEANESRLKVISSVIEIDERVAVERVELIAPVILTQDVGADAKLYCHWYVIEAEELLMSSVAVVVDRVPSP